MTYAVNLMILFLCVWVGHWAKAQSITELTIKSPSDQFSLQQVGRRFQLNGKPVKLGALEDVLHVFRSEIEGPCDLKGKPDLIIRAKVGGKAVERRFFIPDRTVSDGRSCATIKGEGVFYLPMHRHWFEDNRSDGIAVERQLIIKSGEEILVSFRESKGSWQNESKDFYVNWDFLQKFIDSLRTFTVNYNLHSSAGANKPSFTVKTGGRTYTFFKINPTLWAMQRPGDKWLVGSNNWTFWLDMERTQWADRLSDKFKIISDDTSPAEIKADALKSLEGQWSPSIRDSLTQLLRNESVDTSLRLEAVKLFQQKPNLENMGILVQTLTSVESTEILAALTQALRLRNPHGPILNSDASPSDVASARQAWKMWWQQVKDKKE